MNILRRMFTYGLRVTAGVALVLMTFSMGAGAGFLSRPAVEHDYGVDILMRTGVDVRRAQTTSKDESFSLKLGPIDVSQEVIIIGVTPDGLVVVSMPTGLEELVASGATHLIKISIKERSRAAFCKLETMLPKTGQIISIGLGGVVSFDVDVTEITYPEPPVEGEDDF